MSVQAHRHGYLLKKTVGLLAMLSLGCESYEALTTPQPQTREKRNSVELRLFEAQMFRTRKYWHPPCKGTDRAQISDPRVQVSLTFLTHQAV